MAWGNPQGQAGFGPTTSPSGGVQTPDPYTTAYNTYLTGAQPDLQQIQLDQDAARRNMGYNFAKQGLSAAELQNQYGMSMGDLAQQSGDNAIQLGAIPRQMDYQSLLQSLAGQMLGVSNDSAQSQSAQQLASLRSGAVANGAAQSQGFRTGKDFNARDLANTLAGNSIQFNRENAGYIENKAQLQDRKAQLELEAQNLGMKPAQLKTQLDNSLAMLGLNTQMTSDDLLDGLRKGDLTALSIYNSIIQSAGQYATATKK